MENNLLESIKERFNTTDNWKNYLPLLLEALEQTEGLVLEYGMGDGSTPLLHDYCKATGRMLISYDGNREWANKYEHLASDMHKIYYVDNWDEAFNSAATVVLIDHAPGERRGIDIVKYSKTGAYVVCHDTEPAADHGYQMRQHFKLFATVKEIETSGAWATLLK